MAESLPAGAREALLSRIRQIHGEDTTAADIAREWTALPRAYNVTAALDHVSKVELLAHRLHDYDASVYRVRPHEVASTAQAILASLELMQVLVPAGLPPEWLPCGIDCVQERDFVAEELNRFVAVLTGCTLAIAETGTLVLQNAAGQGRRAVSLVPDVHLCVLHVSDVVWSVPEAIRRLQPTATLPTTFVSGPSATADIEMTRIKGVHGPRFLHVLLVQP